MKCEFDKLSEKELETLVVDWLGNCKLPKTTIEEIDVSFNTSTPRSIFFKNLKESSKLLDLGAGDGTLSIYKKWPSYNREDIKMYALSLSIGEQFGNYEKYEIKNFETETVFDSMNFDAVVCAHFIEHMQSPESTISFFSNRLNKGGRVYLEWPHPISMKMPSRSKLLDRGINISTTRFDDDHTHIKAWDIKYIEELLIKYGLQIESMGRLHLPYIAEEMKNHGHYSKDIVKTTLGLWSYIGWPQYIVGFKAHD